MWFRYPPGIDNINVQEQTFGVDYKDRDGNQFFRAPESLSKSILVIPGFAVVTRPADAPADLTDDTPEDKADPLAQLSSQVETIRTENEALKKGVSELTAERDALKAQVEALGRQLAQAGQQAEAATAGSTAPTVGTTGPAIGSGATSASTAPSGDTTTESHQDQAPHSGHAPAHQGQRK